MQVTSNKVLLVYGINGETGRGKSSDGRERETRGEEDAGKERAVINSGQETVLGNE